MFLLTKYRPDEKSLRAPLQGPIVGGVIGAAAGNSNTRQAWCWNKALPLVPLRGAGDANAGRGKGL